MIRVAKCPYCLDDVSVSLEPALGQMVTCASCGERLEIVGLHPVELDYEGYSGLDDYDDDFLDDDFDDDF